MVDLSTLNMMMNRSSRTAPAQPRGRTGRPATRAGQSQSPNTWDNSGLMTLIRAIKAAQPSRNNPRAQRAGRPTMASTQTGSAASTFAGPTLTGAFELPYPMQRVPGLPSATPTTNLPVPVAQAPPAAAAPAATSTATATPPSQLQSAAKSYMDALGKGPPDPTKSKGDVASALIMGGLNMMAAGGSGMNLGESLAQGGIAGLNDYRASKAQQAAVQQQQYESQLARAAAQFDTTRALEGERRDNRAQDIDQQRVDVLRQQGAPGNESFQRRIDSLNQVYRQANPDASTQQINEAVWQALTGRKQLSGAELRMRAITELNKSVEYQMASETEKRSMEDALIQRIQQESGVGMEPGMDMTDPMNLFNGP